MLKVLMRTVTYFLFPSFDYFCLNTTVFPRVQRDGVAYFSITSLSLSSSTSWVDLMRI